MDDVGFGCRSLHSSVRCSPRHVALSILTRPPAGPKDEGEVGSDMTTVDKERPMSQVNRSYCPPLLGPVSGCRVPPSVPTPSVPEGHAKRRKERSVEDGKGPGFLVTSRHFLVPRIASHRSSRHPAHPRSHYVALGAGLRPEGRRMRLSDGR